MSVIGYILVLVVILLPIAWLISVFKGEKGTQCVLGSMAILSSFCVAILVGELNKFNYNAWYGSATKSLIDTSIEVLEKGETEKVIAC